MRQAPQYKQRPTGQNATRMTRPAAGLNAYNPAHDINDNLMSDLLDALPLNDSSISLYSHPSTTATLSSMTDDFVGYIYSAIAGSGADGVEHIYAMSVSGATCLLLDYDTGTGIMTTYDITAHISTTEMSAIGSFSVCRYQTEVAEHIVFSCSAVKKLFWIKIPNDGSGRSNGAIDLAFNPRKILSHANRIFAIDMVNTLWWSRAGNPFNDGIADSWYGTHTESSILEDAGYWVIEREQSLPDFCLLSGAIHIFGRHNTYIFQGTNYDTFNLQVMITDFGIKGDLWCQPLAVSGNVAYVVSNDEVYEYNGSDRPRLISHPQSVNGAYTNGVFGGIPAGRLTHLAVDRDYVYYYDRSRNPSTTYLGENPLVYMFHIATRTWWAKTGFSDAASGVTNNFTVLYIPNADRSGIYGIVSNYALMNGKYYWSLYNIVGTLNVTKPYVVTKAFSNMPSDRESLTAIVLQFSGTYGQKADINVYVSIGVTGTDFNLVYSKSNHMFAGDLEELLVYMPVSAVANAPHYRIKVETGDSMLVLYNIERRIRVKGMSR